MQSLDLVVLGTGEAGSTAATRCRATGWQVAIVDYGGTCGLRGFDPKGWLPSSRNYDVPRNCTIYGARLSSIGRNRSGSEKIPNRHWRLASEAEYSG